MKDFFIIGLKTFSTFYFFLFCLGLINYCYLSAIKASVEDFYGFSASMSDNFFVLSTWIFTITLLVMLGLCMIFIVYSVISFIWDR